MCGIAGFAFNDNHRIPDQSDLIAMAETLHHRGPDDQGVFATAGCGLAMSRLAIIDVADGQQPIRSEDDSIVAVFNGEIYNYRELAKQLSDVGHRLRSKCDAEVIVHLYEEHGIDFVNKLRGMFAIGLWDVRRKRLVLARDRLGVKPLYYHVGGSQLTFASEVKALLQFDSVPREPNLLAIDYLMRFGHFAPDTQPFANIAELPAATVVCFHNGLIEQREYWGFAETIDTSAVNRTRFNQPGSVKALESHIKAAVSERLTSDVPLGAFLSGGIDSSVIVALMSQQMDEPIDTFSIGFEDAAFDERPFARTVSQFCGTRHHEFVVQPDVEQVLPHLIRYHDAPFYDTSAIPTYYLCQLARQHVTVAISGDGGDELFAGYNIFAANQAASVVRRIPQSLRNNVLSRIIDRVPETSTYVNRGRVLKEFMSAVDLEPIERYARWNSKVKFEARDELYHHELLRDCLRRSNASYFLDEYCRFANATELDRQLYLAMKHELAADMLVKVDRMSMAHGLEVRSPLLSHELFEFAATLPDCAKLWRFKGKRLLRDLARQLLPKHVVCRPKRGFCVPLDRWLRTSLAEFSRAILLDQQTHRRGLFRTDTVEAYLKEHASGMRSRSREIWTMLTVEMWFRMYIDKSPAIGGATLEPISLHASVQREKV